MTIDDAMTRREVLRGGAVLVAGGVIAACGGGGGGGGGQQSGAPVTGKLRTGGALRVGATGGGAKDTIDAHRPTADTDIMRA